PASNRFAADQCHGQYAEAGRSGCLRRSHAERFGAGRQRQCHWRQRLMETLRYHTLEELRKLSTRELHVLWELVPTDRQRAYKAAYEREVRTAGAIGSDQLEREVAAELLQRYDTTALIPIGSRWARTPTRVQDAARQNVILDAPEDDSKSASGKP